MFTAPINDTVHPADHVQSVVSGTIGAIGIPGNLFLMVLIASRRQARKPYEWQLFTLALSDFILCLNNVALEAPYITNFNTLQCKVSGGIEYTFGLVCFIVPPFVAYNRYLTLYNNQRCCKLFTTRNIWLCWFCQIGFSMTCFSPYYITGSLGRDDLGLCGTQVKNIMLAIDMVWILNMAVFGYVFLIFFSYKVIVKIRNHNKQAVTESHIHSGVISETQQIIKAILVVSAIPMFAQIPGITVKMLQIFLPPFHPWISHLSDALFPSTSAANGYVTIYVIKNYRKSALKILHSVSQALAKANAKVAPGNAVHPIQ